MAKQNDFFELYRHPLWQEKRLRIMERDGFKCEECGSAEKTLNVHHKYYVKNAKPWEYPDTAFRTLCEDCHSKWHKISRTIKSLVGTLPTVKSEQVMAYAFALLAKEMGSLLIPADSPEIIQGIADAWGMAVGEVMESVADGATTGNDLRYIADGKHK